MRNYPRFAGSRPHPVGRNIVLTSVLQKREPKEAACERASHW